MVNIKDVAKQANVSVATVSRYLNNKGYISKDAQTSIEQAIEKLQYKPSFIARSLSKKQSKMIGVVVPDIQNPYFPQLARAIEDTALTYGYTVILCNTDSSIEKEKQYIESLSQNYVAGLLVVTSIQHEDFYSTIKMPIVAIDRLLSNQIPAVISDNEASAKKAANYLVANGVSNVLCIRGPKGVDTADRRATGFIEGIDGKYPVKTITTAFDFNEAYATIHKVLQENPQIDGIFASSDVMAIAAIKSLQVLNRRVPEEVQVIGFDGITLGKMISPELTTINQDIYRIGKDATEMLISQIEGKHIEHKIIMVPTTLEIGGTTRKEHEK